MLKKFFALQNVWKRSSSNASFSQDIDTVPSITQAGHIAGLSDIGAEPPLQSEDAWYERALDELDNGQTVRAVLARAIAEADGDEARSKAAYIRLRVTQLRTLYEADITTKGIVNVEMSFEDGEAAYKRGDYTTALPSMRQAAGQGHPAAQNILGEMYGRGQGLTLDFREAVKWYRLAADQGHADAQFSLGNRYCNGQGVPRNDKEAVKWYRQAAEQGYADAQNSLGIRYAEGLGVPRSRTEAIRWLKLAAKQGHVNAKKNLEVITRDQFWQSGIGRM